MKIRKVFNLKDMVCWGLISITAGAIGGYGVGNYRGAIRGFDKAEKVYQESLDQYRKMGEKLPEMVKTVFIEGYKAAEDGYKLDDLLKILEEYSEQE